MKEKLMLEMTKFNAGDPQQIQHFLKVYEFAHIIGKEEQIPDETLRILDMASIMHDIGIRPSMEKYGKCDGPLQEAEGPAYAREMLANFPDVTEAETERICYLIAHHHTYTGVNGMDYQILLEADYLVNAFEGKASKEQIMIFRKNVFRTKTGATLLNIMFGLEEAV